MHLPIISLSIFKVCWHNFFLLFPFDSHFHFEHTLLHTRSNLLMSTWDSKIAQTLRLFSLITWRTSVCLGVRFNPLMFQEAMLYIGHLDIRSACPCLIFQFVTNPMLLRLIIHHLSVIIIRNTMCIEWDLFYFTNWYTCFDKRISVLLLKQTSIDKS